MLKTYHLEYNTNLKTELYTIENCKFIKNANSFRPNLYSKGTKIEVKIIKFFFEFIKKLADNKISV